MWLWRPGTYSVDQVGLKLKETPLPLPPKCWDLRHTWLFFFFGLVFDTAGLLTYTFLGWV